MDFQGSVQDTSLPPADIVKRGKDLGATLAAAAAPAGSAGTGRRRRLTGVQQQPYGARHLVNVWGGSAGAAAVLPRRLLQAPQAAAAPPPAAASAAAPTTAATTSGAASVPIWLTYKHVAPANTTTLLLGRCSVTLPPDASWPWQCVVMQWCTRGQKGKACNMHHPNSPTLTVLGSAQRQHRQGGACGTTTCRSARLTKPDCMRLSHVSAFCRAELCHSCNVTPTVAVGFDFAPQPCGKEVKAALVAAGVEIEEDAYSQVLVVPPSVSTTAANSCCCSAFAVQCAMSVVACLLAWVIA